MVDIHIVKGSRGAHTIRSTSARGKKWIEDNIHTTIPEAQIYVEVPIASEYADEIAALIRKDDLDVDVD